jgi:hypothetical protein
MLIAADNVNAGLQSRDFTQIFFSLQNLLNAAANVSKALWGQGGKFTKKRKPIRDSIGISDNSPLREVSMRNNYEHFDERLEKWERESKRHNSMDFGLTARSAVRGIDAIDWFRVFDPQTTDVHFWRDDFNMQQLIDEVHTILPKLREEAGKPPWDAPPEGVAAANGTDLHAATPDDGHNAPPDQITIGS